MRDILALTHCIACDTISIGRLVSSRPLNFLERPRSTSSHDGLPIGTLEGATGQPSQPESAIHPRPQPRQRLWEGFLLLVVWLLYRLLVMVRISTTHVDHNQEGPQLINRRRRQLEHRCSHRHTDRSLHCWAIMRSFRASVDVHRCPAIWSHSHRHGWSCTERVGTDRSALFCRHSRW